MKLKNEEWVRSSLPTPYKNSTLNYPISLDVLKSSNPTHLTHSLSLPLSMCVILYTPLHFPDSINSMNLCLSQLVQMRTYLPVLPERLNHSQISLLAFFSLSSWTLNSTKNPLWPPFSSNQMSFVIFPQQWILFYWHSANSSRLLSNLTLDQLWTRVSFRLRQTVSMQIWSPITRPC